MIDTSERVSEGASQGPPRARGADRAVSAEQSSVSEGASQGPPFRLETVRSLSDLALALRELRRRHARRHGEAELTYRELAARTGWSHGIIGEYLGGRVLPPTDRFDVLTRLLGATPAEQGALATARDRVEEGRRGAVARIDVEVPRQLPVEAYGFCGRADQLAALDAVLDQDIRTPAVVISAIAGTAGVGKTTLAVRWAHRVAQRFPDGQLYVDLRGYDEEPPLSAGDALARFLRGLGLAATDVPADRDERAARYRTLLAGRRVLVVLDNASSADQVRPLLPGTATCLVLVTSRDSLSGLVAREGARRIDLDVLTPDDATAVLQAVIGARVDAEPQAASELAELCAYLPLALRIAAEAAVAQPNRTLRALVGDLADESSRLDQLSVVGDPRTAVRTVFSWSYRRLSPVASAAFGLLGLHPGRDIDVYDVVALAGCDLVAAQAAVDELVQAHLLAASGGGVYRMHDLLRTYARERAPGEQAPLTRLFDHYVHNAGRAAGVLFPHDRPTQPFAMVSLGPSIDDTAAAQSWLDEHRANLVAVAQFAASNGWPRHTVELSRVLWRHFEVGGHYQEALTVHTSAEAAAHLADAAERDVPAVLANLGNVHWWLGDYRDALVYFERALAGHREAGDRDGEARALARLGVVHERLGEYATALARLADALESYRSIDNLHGEGVQLINLGALQRRLGHPDDAASQHERAARLFADLGDRRLEGYALGNLGADYGLLGRYAEALRLLERALEQCREAADPGGQASAIATMGSVYRRLGQFSDALERLHQALAMSRDTSERGLETEILNSLGETLLAMGEASSARDRHQAALALAQRTGDPFEQARALDGLANAHQAAAELAVAKDHWQQALAIYERLGATEASSVRAKLSSASR